MAGVRGPLLIILTAVLLLLTAVPHSLAVPLPRVAQAVNDTLDGSHPTRPPTLRARQDDAQPSFLTVPRVVYPTGFDGFDTGPGTISLPSTLPTLTALTTPSSTNSPSSTASSTSSSTASSPSSTSTSAGVGISSNDGSTRAIAVIVPVALGTILLLAFGGAIMMWLNSRKQKRQLEEDRATNLPDGKTEEGHRSRASDNDRVYDRDRNLRAEDRAIRNAPRPMSMRQHSVDLARRSPPFAPAFSFHSDPHPSSPNLHRRPRPASSPPVTPSAPTLPAFGFEFQQGPGTPLSPSHASSRLDPDDSPYRHRVSPSASTPNYSPANPRFQDNSPGRARARAMTTPTPTLNLPTFLFPGTPASVQGHPATPLPPSAYPSPARTRGMGQHQSAASVYSQDPHGEGGAYGGMGEEVFKGEDVGRSGGMHLLAPPLSIRTPSRPGNGDGGGGGGGDGESDDASPVSPDMPFLGAPILVISSATGSFSRLQTLPSSPNVDRATSFPDFPSDLQGSGRGCPSAGSEDGTSRSHSDTGYDSDDDREASQRPHPRWLHSASSPSYLPTSLSLPARSLAPTTTHCPVGPNLSPATPTGTTLSAFRFPHTPSQSHSMPSMYIASTPSATASPGPATFPQTPLPQSPAYARSPERQYVKVNGATPRSLQAEVFGTPGREDDDDDGDGMDFEMDISEMDIPDNRSDRRKSFVSVQSLYDFLPAAERAYDNSNRSSQVDGEESDEEAHANRTLASLQEFIELTKTPPSYRRRSLAPDGGGGQEDGMDRRRSLTPYDAETSAQQYHTPSSHVESSEPYHSFDSQRRSSADSSSFVSTSGGVVHPQILRVLETPDQGKYPIHPLPPDAATPVPSTASALDYWNSFLPTVPSPLSDPPSPDFSDDAISIDIVAQ